MKTYRNLTEIREKGRVNSKIKILLQKMSQSFKFTDHTSNHKYGCQQEPDKTSTMAEERQVDDR